METKPYFLKQLEQTFEKRCKRNALYSLRSFARDLSFSPSRLSAVLKGKFGLSRSAAEQLCSTLGYSQKSTALFVESVESLHARSVQQRKRAALEFKRTIHESKSLGMDQFRVVSDWCHFAIMELTQTRSLKKESSTSVAKALGISPIEAKLAIERLLEFELLVVNEKGCLTTSGSYLARSAIPNDAVWKHNRQLIDKGKEAIEMQSLSERNISSLTISIDRESFPELEKVIRKFQDDLKTKANESKTKNEVYALTLQFFKLTQKE